MTHIELYNVVDGFSLKSELAVYCQRIMSARSALTASSQKNFAGQINGFNTTSGSGVLNI